MYGEHDGGQPEADDGHPQEAEVHEEVDSVVGEDRLQGGQLSKGASEFVRK